MHVLPFDAFDGASKGRADGRELCELQIHFGDLGGEARVFDAMLLFGKRARFAGGGEFCALQFDVGLREGLTFLGLREFGGFVFID